MRSNRRQQVRTAGRSRVGHCPLAVVLVLLLGVAAVVAGLEIHNAQLGRKEAIVQRFNTRHVTASRFIEAYLRQIVAQQIRLAKQSLSKATVTTGDFATLARLNQLTSASLYDGDGGRLAFYPVRTSRDDSVRSQDGGLEYALAGVPVVTAVAAATEDPPLVAFAVPFQTPTGPRVFTGRYPVDDTLLQSFVANALPTFNTAHTYLVTVAGTVIVADRRDSSGLQLSKVAPVLNSAGAGTSGFLPGEQYYISGPIQGTTWRLAFTLSSAELYEQLTPSQKYAPWAALAAFLGLGLVMIAMFIRALADRTQAIDEHARQEAILESAGDAFIGMDDAGTVTDWNGAATRLLGWTRAEAMGRPGVEKFLPPADQDEYSRRLQTFLGTGVPSGPQPLTLTAQHRDGHLIPVEVTVARSHWLGSWRFHAFMRDVTERLEAERKLQSMALTDSLTGLANRRAFLDQLDQAHARAERHDTRLAVLYGDVDHFKAINDTHGHAAGDAVLRQVAARLRAHFRTEDTVGRLGGDEFAVLCENFTPDSEGLLERLREVLAAPYSFRDQPIRVTVSVGLASPRPGESAASLLERADRTMYRAKAAHHA